MDHSTTSRIVVLLLISFSTAIGSARILFFTLDRDAKKLLDADIRWYPNKKRLGYEEETQQNQKTAGYFLLCLFVNQLDHGWDFSR
jgi:hypothetical protein